MFFKNNWKRGSTPKQMGVISYHADGPLHDYQNKWSWPWPTVPAHETRSALTNCWTGNQLPGDTIFIQSVPMSKYTWNIPTSYANTLVNQQYNQGYNIQSQSAFSSSALQIMAQQAWQNRMS